MLEDLANGAGPKRVLVTLGYSGWSAGQLEDELGRNGWLTVDADPSIIFETPIEQRYDKALSLLGIDPRMLSQEAGRRMSRCWPPRAGCVPRRASAAGALGAA